MLNFQQCLGIHMFDTNKSPEMASMLKILQERYVPCYMGDILENVTLDGDQLTEERARNVQCTFHFGNNPTERLEGLNPTFADWHMKRYLYEVIISLQANILWVLIAKLIAPPPPARQSAVPKTKFTTITCKIFALNLRSVTIYLWKMNLLLKLVQLRPP